MYTFSRFPLSIVLGTLALSFGLAFGASAQDIQGKWGFGLRAGPSFLTQDLNDEDPSVTVEGDTGLAVNAQVFYGVTSNLAAGFMLDWNRNDTTLDVSGLELDLGTLNTISLMPYAEFRGNFQRLAPYVSAGIGVNINTFSEDDLVQAAGIDVDPETTFAIRVAGGADYFLTRTLALNAEFGWKWNDGDVDLTIPGVGTGTDDFNASVISVIFGIRALF